MNAHHPANLPTLRSARSAASALTIALVMAGCTSMSGLGGESRYACKAPEGVACDSVSGTYANAIHNNLPSQRLKQSAELPTSSTPAVPQRPPIAAAPALASLDTLIQAPATGALRSQSRILRLWTKPWEDADGDLYDQGYVYVQIHSGQWLIDHAQQRIRDAYAPLRAPSKATGDAPGEGVTNSRSSIGAPGDDRAITPAAGFPRQSPSPTRSLRSAPLQESE